MQEKLKSCAKDTIFFNSHEKKHDNIGFFVKNRPFYRSSHFIAYPMALFQSFFVPL